MWASNRDLALNRSTAMVLFIHVLGFWQERLECLQFFISTKNTSVLTRNYNTTSTTTRHSLLVAVPLEVAQMVAINLNALQEVVIQMVVASLEATLL